MITRTIPVMAILLAIILGSSSGRSGASDINTSPYSPQPPQVARDAEPLLPDRMKTLYVIPEQDQAVRQTSFHQPVANAPVANPPTTAPRAVAVRQPQLTPAAMPVARPFDSQAMAAGNPFDYERSGSDSNETTDGFYPTKLVSLPPEIQLVGILILQEREPIAAIRFPGAGKQLGEVHYVREGDDIEIPSSLLRPAGRPAKAGAQVAEIDEIIYLKVRKITSRHVEVSSQSNMADRHFLR